MAKPRVLVTTHYLSPGGPVDRRLQEEGFEPEFNPYRGPREQEEMIDLLRGKVGMISGPDQLTAPVFAAAGQLRVVSRSGAGFDGVDLAAATSRGIVVCGPAGANRKAVAEYTMGLLLACARKMLQNHSEVMAGNWVRHMGKDLAASTLGVVGLGAIGKEVAKRALAFEMRVLVHTRTPDPTFAAQYPVSYVPLDQLLRESDFVSLNLALNDESRHLINAERLSLMKPTAYIVNTARGGIIDTEALYQALKEKRIAGAGLDVFEQEPLRDSPLRELDNVFLSPHAAAHTPETLGASGMTAAENLIRVLRGESPTHILNPEVLKHGACVLNSRPSVQ